MNDALLDLESRMGLALEDQQNQIDSFHTLVAPATCADLAFSQHVWGTLATGLDLRKYNSSTLHFVGCAGSGHGFSCTPASFFCDNDVAAGTLSFGTTSLSHSLVAQVDPQNTLGDTINTSVGTCALDVTPQGISTLPAGESTADALCRNLGYAEGTSTTISSSTACVSIRAAGRAGEEWTLGTPGTLNPTPVRTVDCTGGN